MSVKDGVKVSVKVGVNVAVMVKVSVKLVVNEAVCVGVGVYVFNRMGIVMVLVKKVTSAFRAKARPSKTAPVSKMMASSARIFPLNDVVVPRVQVVLICQ